jgi:hypothetical protein
MHPGGSGLAENGVDIDTVSRGVVMVLENGDARIDSSGPSPIRTSAIRVAAILASSVRNARG